MNELKKSVNSHKRYLKKLNNFLNNEYWVEQANKYNDISFLELREYFNDNNIIDKFNVIIKELNRFMRTNNPIDNNLFEEYGSIISCFRNNTKVNLGDVRNVGLNLNLTLNDIIFIYNVSI